MVKLLTGVGVILIMVGLLGPVYDHHFAERLPLHSHIGFTAGTADHLHTYQAPHTHHGRQQGQHGASEKTAPHDATIAVAPGDALSVAFVATGISPTQTVSLAVGLPNGALTPLFPREPLLLTPLALSPLALPPRAAL